MSISSPFSLLAMVVGAYCGSPILACNVKPHPDCYALIEKTLGLKNDEVMFVSSNGFDVAGAKHFGFKVAWIRRSGSTPLPPGPVGPAQIYRLLRGNHETLGYLQDYTVAALTDLVGLL